MRRFISSVDSMDRRLGVLRLEDLDIAGAGADVDERAAAVDDAVDVMAVEVALHGDGLGDLNGAGAGVGVEIKFGIADDQVDGAAAGGELPVGGGLAGDLNVSAAGGGFECAGDAVEMDAAAAGLSLNVAGASVLEFDAA